jgi:uncharacterized membrane protein YoaK (UPF0700 family)
MSTFFTEVRETLFPRLDSKDGPLPPMLVGMTLVTGLVDSFSYLVLGHVFVANMTGNVVFLAFALAGAQGFSIASSLLAVASFVSGAFCFSLLGKRVGEHRGRLLFASTVIQALLLGFSTGLSAVSGNPIPTSYVYGLIIPLGFSMGMQNAVARKLAVPDLTTTVLTLTIVGMAADSRIAGGGGARLGRRLVSVLAMFVGALIGTLTILYVSASIPLAIGFVVIAIVAVSARVLSQRNLPWSGIRQPDR